jgi:hypothetical protein
LYLATEWCRHQKESLNEGKHRAEEGVGDDDALLQFVEALEWAVLNHPCFQGLDCFLEDVTSRNLSPDPNT